MFKIVNALPLLILLPIQLFAGEKSIEIINDRVRNSIWKVYITPAGSENWGTDQLNDQVIAAGKSYTWTIPWKGCFVDVKAVTRSGISVENRNLNVCGGITWTIYDVQENVVKEVRVINNREEFPIWKVFITPAGEDSWGEDQLNSNVIDAGQTFKWTIPWQGCMIDIKATTYSGLTAERRNLNVCGGIDWIVADPDE